MTTVTTTYLSHTITRCGLSWYVDRHPGTAGGERYATLGQARAAIRALAAWRR